MKGALKPDLFWTGNRHHQKQLPLKANQLCALALQTVTLETIHWLKNGHFIKHQTAQHEQNLL